MYRDRNRFCPPYSPREDANIFHLVSGEREAEVWILVERQYWTIEIEVEGDCGKVQYTMPFHGAFSGTRFLKVLALAEQAYRDYEKTMRIWEQEETE